MTPSDTQIKLPTFVYGFAILMVLPVLIAVFDVGVGRQIPYVTRLTFWNLPWAIVGGTTIFLTWADARRKKETFWSVNAMDTGVLLVLLGLSVVLSRTIAANPAASDMHLIRLVMAIFLGVSALYGMRTLQAHFSLAIYHALTLAALTVMPFVLFFVYFQGYSRELGEALAWYIPGFGPVRLFGTFNEVAIMLSIGLILTSSKRQYVVLLSVALVVLWAALFWSGGRGAVISMLLTTAIFSLVFRDLAGRMWLFLLASAVCGGLISLLLWVPEGTAFGLKNMILNMLRDDANALSSGRLERWIETISLIKDHPIFGHGLNQFSNIWSKYAEFDAQNGGVGPQSIYFLSYRNVHNIALESLFSWGLVGGILFLVVLFRTWIKALMRAVLVTRTNKLPAILALTSLLFHANLTGVYMFPHTLIYMAVFFGICLAPDSAQNENTNR